MADYLASALAKIKALATPSPEVYVYRVKRGHRSGRGTYWRPDGQGYTDDLAQAGRYTSPDGVVGSETAEAVLLSDLEGPVPLTQGEAQVLLRLLKGAVANAGQTGPRRPRWGAVADAFGLGSSSAVQLCTSLGLHPDEMVPRG